MTIINRTLSKVHAYGKTLRLVILVSVFSPHAFAQEHILIHHVNVWDGTSDHLNKDYQVLVEDNLILAVGKNLDVPTGARRIDGKGKTLIPGMSDAHTHITYTGAGDRRNDASWMYVSVRAAKSAENYLKLGFTTIRDLGGPSFGVKRAIDEGIIPGPRIYPSGAYISQTSGHGDLRNPNEANRYLAGGPLMPHDQQGYSYVVDGKDEVLKAVRENLRKGATQIKVMAGGGISSRYDPIHTVQFTPPELEAAVKAATDWDAYVAVHAYTPESIIRALNAGVMSIEHGQLANEEAIQLIKQKNAWMVPQSYWNLKPGPDPTAELTARQQKSLLVRAGIMTSMALAKKYDINLGYGTDSFGRLGGEERALQEFTSRVRWYKPIEVLKQATSGNARLLAMSGKMNPYTEGKIGVVEPGAYADILIYEGNPLEDEQVIVNYQQNLKFIMKDGSIYKNEL
jgi:imidazolonepropionase-like amidohydrolase